MDSRKPILIDALHICMGGGLMILNHLINHLVARDVSFVLLKDARCPSLQSEEKVKRIETLPSSFRNRYKYYKRHKEEFRSVLCFGNVPPYVKLDVPVHTYMHNVSLLKIPKDYSFKRKALSYLKRCVLLRFSKNTTDWIVQTSNTASLVREVFSNANQNVLEYPFFYLPKELSEKSERDRTDYVFVGDYTNAKGHEYLVEAWTKLHRMGIDLTLHLTVSDPVFCRWIEACQAEGVKIVNHGLIPFSYVIGLYKKSKATIYPSLNESLGLGIIEAMAAGCDVIGCNLPYLHSVCRPSATFAPCDPHQIVKAVLKYEEGNCHKTQALISDKINEFVSYIVS
ncbi:MAG: glycosyltransferase [Bacteroides sp.]|nr:glycosyltransferase [Bacteroides sp.]